MHQPDPVEIVRQLYAGDEAERASIARDSVGDKVMKTTVEAPLTTVQMTAAIIDGRHFETVHYPDDELWLRVTKGGNVQVIEYLSTDRPGPPPHYHPWHEIEYVIEGEVEFYLGGSWIAGGPGTVQLLPAGVAHSVRVPQGSARLLMITIGALFDGFSRELAALYAQAPTDWQGVVAVAGRHGVRLEGDPGGSGR